MVVAVVVCERVFVGYMSPYSAAYFVINLQFNSLVEVQKQNISQDPDSSILRLSSA